MQVGTITQIKNNKDKRYKQKLNGNGEAKNEMTS